MSDTEIYTHKCPTHGTERCFQKPPRLWPAWALKLAISVSLWPASEGIRTKWTEQLAVKDG